MGGAFTKYSSSSSSSKQQRNNVVVVTDIDRAVLDLKNARDRLHRYRQKLEHDDVKLVAQARRAKQANRPERALGLLRLRKYKQEQARNCENQLLNVLQMVETIGSKQNESAVLQALATGKDTLKKMHEETTVEDVLHLMDEIQEEAQVEQEITDILSAVPTLSPADEEAVEAELAAMAAEMNGVTTTTATTTTKLELPEVPTDKLPEPVVVQTPAKKQEPERVAVPG